MLQKNEKRNMGKNLEIGADKAVFHNNMTQVIKKNDVSASNSDATVTRSFRLCVENGLMKYLTLKVFEH